ncbi:MAG: neutral/alkaline non-lysosomal ceramidase N-terminal domain-containing protein [Myxococcota bacterium]
MPPRRASAAAPAILLALTLAACDGDASAPSTADTRDAVPDAPADAIHEVATPDADAIHDAEPDVPEPDPGLRLSVASRDLFAPVGISTAGYGQKVTSASPRSPFADAFQATTGRLHPPRVQVVHLTRGDDRLLLAQTDLVAVTDPVRQAVVDEIEARAGADVRDALVLAANHAHSSPGRLFDLWVAPFFADTFEPGVLGRQVDAIAAAVVEALEAPTRPVRAGIAELDNAAMHSDRRCENPEHQRDTLGLLRLDALDGDGETLAVVLSYAVHGTVLNYPDALLGGDAPHTIELKVQEALDGAPLVMLLESWAGDMAPTDLRDAWADEDRPAADEPKLDRMEALGRSAAETILAAWDDVAWQDDPALDVVSARAPVDWETLGYTDDVFPHRDGAFMCGGGEPECGAKPDDMTSCFPLPEGEAPTRALLSAFRIGDLVAATIPGEPVTPLAEALLEHVTPDAPGPVWLVGYAQGYQGYLLTADDWWSGGYEPSVSYWGPWQGRYLVERSASMVRHLLDPEEALDFAPTSAPPAPPTDGGPYAPATSESFGEIVEDLPAEAVAGDTLRLSWTGGDPWLDVPEVTLLREDPDTGKLAPVVAGGRPVDHRDYRTVVGLDVAPSWREVPAPAEDPPARTFTWDVRLRTAVRIPAPEQALTGRFRLRVRGRALADGGTIGSYEVLSAPVVVSP